jgi:uncharacterized protein (DUF1800 family)
MGYTPELAEIRFGCGLSPRLDGPADPGAMLAGLRGPDAMATAFPIEPFDQFRTRMIAMKDLRKQMKKVRGTPQFDSLRKQRNLANKAARQDMVRWHGQMLLRWTHTSTGFRERLARFWGDHFTANGKAGVSRRARSPYIEEAIRPHLTGRFEDMLIAVETHPVMLMYLDQVQSTGPASNAGKRSKGKRGLNENLAREAMELHTLGVEGTYTQDDVRQLAELFTGLTFQPQAGFKFNRNMAEPGAETVLGRSYGGDPARLEPVLNALRDLARHPDTARHLSWKLAVHFVADDPDPDLIAAMTTTYRDTGGDLEQVYAVMLGHPAAWREPLRNVKPPFDFIASSCRALAISPERIAGMKENRMRTMLMGPMALMGQPWQNPTGPDGWAEEDEAWITPQGIATRLRWAVTVPQVLQPKLPDPRVFVSLALGDNAPPAVHFAASAAESRADAIGLVLSSPAFQRR